jgi:hypothetical protein
MAEVWVRNDTRIIDSVKWLYFRLNRYGLWTAMYPI